MSRITSKPQYYAPSHQIMSSYSSRPQPYQMPPNSTSYPMGYDSKLRYSGVSDADTDFMVYCPVCKVDYLNSQVNMHMRKHYVADSYNFSSTYQKDLNKTNESVISSYGEATSYPLIEPLEFYTNQLDEVAKQDRYKFILNEDYDDLKNQKEPMNKSSVNVQTESKPSFQRSAKNTNLYNCLDNMANDDSFSMADVFGNNEGLAGKRQLNQWEDMALNNKR